MIYYAEELIGFAVAVGRALGMANEEAEDFGRSLVFADLRGLHSHGLMRLSSYVRRIQKGLVQVGTGISVTRDGGSLLRIDANNTMGMCAARQAMALCMARARETGMCLAAVYNGNHFGCSGYFTLPAARAHMMGFAASNAFRTVAPFGGSAPMLGTNPLSIAIPAGDRAPFLLDMATSVAAQGKIILADKEGRPIPLGWGLDCTGTPTTDPHAVLNGGTLVPFGGAKGYGIALMIEILCVALCGAASSRDTGSLYDETRKQNTGFVLGAVDVSRVMDVEEFETAAARLFDDMKASPKAPGISEIFIPGEIEERKAAEARENGVELGEAVSLELRELGEEFGLAFPEAR